MLNQESSIQKDENQISKTIDTEDNLVNGIISPKLHKNKYTRSLVIRRMNEEEKDKDIIATEINDYFNSPDKYFECNSPVSIDREIKLNEISLNEKSLKHMVTKKGNKILNNFSYFSPKKKNNGLTSIITSSSGNNIPEQMTRFEIIDNEKLKNIFDSYQDVNNKKSFIKENNLDKNNNNFPLNLSKSLSVQKHRLNSSKNNQKNLRQMSGYLCKRINKKNKDLLINSVDSYAYKKELINEINHKEFNEEYPRLFWRMNLRRNDIGRREGFVNVKNNYDPFWAIIVDDCRNIKEKVIKPKIDLNSKDLYDFKKNKYLLNKFSKKIKNMDKIETLNVEGKNLFNVEYNREMSSKRRKILHRIFIDNGKEISDTDINDVFGEQTIYKNYPKDAINIKGKKNNLSRNLFD